MADEGRRPAARVGRFAPAAGEDAVPRLRVAPCRPTALAPHTCSGIQLLSWTATLP